MLSYSPVDNVEAKDYPPIYIRRPQRSTRPVLGAGQVGGQAAAPRRPATRPLLLKTEMGAGHGGPSGRYGIWEDEARVQAFVLECVGLQLVESEPAAQPTPERRLIAPPTNA